MKKIFLILLLFMLCINVFSKMPKALTPYHRLGINYYYFYKNNTGYKVDKKRDILVYKKPSYIDNSINYDLIILGKDHNNRVSQMLFRVYKYSSKAHIRNIDTLLQYLKNQFNIENFKLTDKTKIDTIFRLLTTGNNTFDYIDEKLDYTKIQYISCGKDKESFFLFFKYQEQHYIYLSKLPDIQYDLKSESIQEVLSVYNELQSLGLGTPSDDLVKRIANVIIPWDKNTFMFTFNNKYKNNVLNFLTTLKSNTNIIRTKVINNFDTALIEFANNYPEIEKAKIKDQITSANWYKTFSYDFSFSPQTFNGEEIPNDYSFESYLRSTGIADQLESGLLSDSPVKLAIIDNGLDMSDPAVKNNITQKWGLSQENNVNDLTNSHATINSRIAVGINVNIQLFYYNFDFKASTYLESLNMISKEGIMLALFAYAIENSLINYYRQFPLFKLLEIILVPIWNNFIVPYILENTYLGNLNDFLIAKNILLIKAAGNNKINAAFNVMNNLDSSLVVGATDYKGFKADFSCYGDAAIDVFAPGIIGLNLNTSGSYDTSSGTSLSASFVAGWASHLVASKICTTPNEVKEYIKENEFLIKKNNNTM